MHCPFCRRAASFLLLRRPPGSFYRCPCGRSSCVAVSRRRHAAWLGAAGLGAAVVSAWAHSLPAGLALLAVLAPAAPLAARQLREAPSAGRPNPVLAAAYNPRQYRRPKD